jgi:hypothetical protein
MVEPGGLEPGLASGVRSNASIHDVMESVCVARLDAGEQSDTRCEALAKGSKLVRDCRARPIDGRRLDVEQVDERADPGLDVRALQHHSMFWARR